MPDRAARKFPLCLTHSGHWPHDCRLRSKSQIRTAVTHECTGRRNRSGRNEVRLRRGQRSRRRAANSCAFPPPRRKKPSRRSIEFFQTQRAKLGPLAAIGIASFGPIDPKPGSPTFGYITSTPKPGWGNTDFAGAVARALSVPVGFDTDVNVAALGEWRWGAGQGLDNLIYLTIGTGIGGGGLVNGKLMHGLVHPEMGHIRVPHDLAADPYPGHCPYHGDCLEGLACGPAMNERWQQPSQNLPADHPAWALEAEYLAWALVNIICTLSPERIILGGGVMSQRATVSAHSRSRAATAQRLRPVAGDLSATSIATSCRPDWEIAPACWARSPWRSRLRVDGR